MELKLIDNSKQKEYFFNETDYRITYMYEHTFSCFTIRIETKFDDKVFKSELESFADEIKDLSNLEAQLILNGNVNKILNVEFDKYSLSHSQNIFGSEVVIEDVHLRCV